MPRSQIHAELEAQMEVCRDHGISPSHVDSHMHFHAVPALGELVSSLAGRFGVATVRNPDLSAFIVPPFGRAKLVEKDATQDGYKRDQEDPTHDGSPGDPAQWPGKSSRTANLSTLVP